ncbi:hypothetical protein NDU88_000689 [Pleurodeles waltl]|uniref:Uncharacterized protein n=1 Tax=Pleurodeles waltl TaxID=8319 RepID=A0AAV7L7N3_PLEWA|nr:hypothetical protein NDU88_000689 [Pleurodeles waltl]
MERCPLVMDDKLGPLRCGTPKSEKKLHRPSGNAGRADAALPRSSNCCSALLGLKLHCPQCQEAVPAVMLSTEGM